MCGVYIGEVKEKEEKEQRENVFCEKTSLCFKNIQLEI